MKSRLGPHGKWALYFGLPTAALVVAILFIYHHFEEGPLNQTLPLVVGIAWFTINMGVRQFFFLREDKREEPKK